MRRSWSPPWHVHLPSSSTPPPCDDASLAPSPRGSSSTANPTPSRAAAAAPASPPRPKTGPSPSTGSPASSPLPASSSLVRTSCYTHPHPLYPPTHSTIHPINTHTHTPPDVVADVDKYKLFLPYCNDSAVLRRTPPNFMLVRVLPPKPTHPNPPKPTHPPIPLRRSPGGFLSTHPLTQLIHPATHLPIPLHRRNSWWGSTRC